jgi:hypothetical protein
VEIVINFDGGTHSESAESEASSDS